MDAMVDRIRVLDTGTRRCEVVPEALAICHEPALVRESLTVRAQDVCAIDDTAHHLFFYSHFAVETLAAQNLIKNPEDHHIWAIGNRTAAAVSAHFGIDAIVPDKQHFQGLRAALANYGDHRPMIAFGLEGKPRDLSDIAGQWQTTFVHLPVYRSCPTDADSLRQRFRHQDPQWISMTSTRGVHVVVDALGSAELADRQKRGQIRLAAIGPATASALAEFDLMTDAQPPTPDRRLLLQAIVDAHF